jgi:hypothetical protein
MSATEQAQRKTLHTWRRSLADEILYLFTDTTHLRVIQWEWLRLFASLELSEEMLS